MLPTLRAEWLFEAEDYRSLVVDGDLITDVALIVCLSRDGGDANDAAVATECREFVGQLFALR